jgi:hypothetical protein
MKLFSNTRMPKLAAAIRATAMLAEEIEEALIIGAHSLSIPTLKITEVAMGTIWAGDE